MRQTLDGFCRENGKEHLLAEWDAERNLPLTPLTVSYGSKQALWWRCKNGHSWQTAVYSRTGGAGCPYCSGKKVGCGNDLVSRCPSLAKEWDSVKNAPLAPSEISAGSHRLVWWRCDCGHSWRARISSRARGSGCPVCAGKKVLGGFNDLASRYPALAAEWDAEKNGALTPRDVTSSSNRKVWWRCSLGHSYAAVIAARTVRGCGCPVCSGRRVLAGFNDLATVKPELAAQWHRELNGALTPEMVTAGSHRSVWWQCASGHVWRAAVYSRAGPQSCGCPVCAGRFRSKARARTSR